MGVIWKECLQNLPRKQQFWDKKINKKSIKNHSDEMGQKQIKILDLVQKADTKIKFQMKNIL